MSDMANHARLTRKQRQALGFAVTVVLAGMAMGFLSSFTTLYHAAQMHRWTFPWLLPLSVDSGIVAYVVLDHLAVTLGSRSRWLHLAAWSLAAFTVWANAAVGASEGIVWRVIHAAMPALWVLGVEALRFTWKRLHELGTPAADSIPRSRWLAAPVPSLLFWRRMHLSYHCGYSRASVLEDARLHAADLIRAACEAEPALAVPSSLQRAVRQGRLPGTVTAAVDSGMTFGGASRWEPAVASWVASALTLPEQAAASLQSARQGIARDAAEAEAERARQAVQGAPVSEPAATPEPAAEDAPQASPEPRPAPRPKPRSAPALRLPASKSRSMSAAELAGNAGAMLDAYGEVSEARVKRDLHVGSEKAGEALRLAREARKGADVIQMAAR